MNPSLDKALYYLTGNGNFDEVAIEDLEKLTRDHPYFSVGHLLLAKKMKIKEDKRFDTQVQKAAVYISNPYWLHYQLLNYPPTEIELYTPRGAKQEGVVHENSEEQAVQVAAPAIEPTDSNDAIATREEINNIEAEVPITTAFTSDEITQASELAHESLSEYLTPEIFHDTTIDPELSEPVPITTEFTSDEIEHASELAHQALADDTMPVVHEEAPFSGAITAEEENIIIDRSALPQDDDGERRIDDPLAFANHEHEASTNIVHSLDTSNNVSQADEEMAAIAGEPDAAAEKFVDEVNEAETAGKPSSFNTTIAEQPVEEDEHEKMFQSIKAMLDASTDEAGKDVEGGIIPMDPYHTIDYFASQGIKLELEPNPQDKLGMQLKKFTHWLRQMKKLGPEDALDNEETPEEAAVQQIADSSNTAREVVTEAMAMVLEKQGKNEKAVQLYIKLSFLNPHKSSYFADKIKNLKGL